MAILTTQAQLRKAKHVAGLMFRCADCKQVKPVHTEGGTGYGYGKDNEPVCYECCGKRDLVDMKATGKATMYLTKLPNGGYEVGNWPGTFKVRANVRIGRHNMAGKRYDAWFTNPADGMVWHGVTYGDNTQICHCKRTKAA